MTPLFELLVIVVLTVLEGFFVAAEIALVSIRRSRVEQLVEEGQPGAQRVQRLIHEPGRFLAVCQLGLTFIGFFASAYAAVSLTDQLSRACSTAPGIDAGRPQGLSLIVVTVLLALFTIVFAELVPKTLALAHAERFALTLSLPIEVLARDPRPGGRASSPGSPAGSPGCSGRHERGADHRRGARLIVERGGEQGILEAEEEQMINAVIELGDQRVHEVMVPAHRDRGAAGHGDARRDDRHVIGRATAASRSTRTGSTRSSASSTPRTCCRS